MGVEKAAASAHLGGVYEADGAELSGGAEHASATLSNDGVSFSGIAPGHAAAYSSELGKTVDLLKNWMSGNFA